MPQPHERGLPGRPRGLRLGGPAALALASLLAAACVDHGRPDPEFTEHAAPPPSTAEQFQVPPPPLSEGVFPCSDCHEDLPVGPRRKLRMAHQDIVLEHDEEHLWCLDCHSAENRDMLHLASGELVPFEESYRLCGQCHGDKYRDWRAGVHGRRTGSWLGEKQYLLCVHCHDSHSPRFKPIQPEPAPQKPRRTP